MALRSVRRLGCTAALLLAGLSVAPAGASSHREASNWPDPGASVADAYTWIVHDFEYSAFPNPLAPPMPNIPIPTLTKASLDISITPIDNLGLPRVGTTESFDLGPAQFPRGAYQLDADLGSFVQQPRFSFRLNATSTISGPNGDLITSTSPNLTLFEGQRVYSWTEDQITYSTKISTTLDVFMYSMEPFRAGPVTTPLALPAGFFGPGSEPFSAPVTLDGFPLQPHAPVDLEPTDTIVRRFGPSGFPGPRSPVVPIEIVALNLISVEPITVRIDGQATTWEVSLQIPPGDTQPHGTLQLERTSPNGGTFDAVLPVRPTIIFTQRNGDQLVSCGPCGPSLITLRDQPWSDTCGTGQIVYPGGPPNDICLQPNSATSDGSTAQWPLVRSTRDGTPAPIVAPSAYVHPSVIVEPGARIDAGAVVNAGALIGHHARIGQEVIVGYGAVVGGYTFVGTNSSIGDGAVLDAGAGVYNGVHVGDRSVIGPSSQILDNVVIGDDTTIGGGGLVMPSSIIGSDTQVGRGSFLGFNTLIDSDLNLAEGTQLEDGENLGVDTITCETGSAQHATTTDDCVDGGGFVTGCTGPAGSSSMPPPGNREVVQGNPTGATKTKLEQDIDDSKVAPGNGGGGYVPTTHDCDDFADELERALTAKGYDSTFTVFWKLNPDYWWGNAPWTDKWIKGHAITDVHMDGKTIWIEPQRSSGQGALTRWNMDFDGDGKVEYDTEPGDEPTDGDYRIEVYDNRAAAEAAGHVLD